MHRERAEQRAQRQLALVIRWGFSCKESSAPPIRVCTRLLLLLPPPRADGRAALAPRRRRHLTEGPSNKLVNADVSSVEPARLVEEEGKAAWREKDMR